jgi:glutathione synthase/RimK-type ligase-like ATP-grasp enzyme
VTVYVLHENPEWYPPFAHAFAAAGVDAREWLLIDGVIDLDQEPPEGVYYNRLSASSHTRGHTYTKDYTRALLEWLESYGRRVVNGRPVVEMEVSKVRQLNLLRAFGIDTPRTVAVIGRDRIVDAALTFPMPFITKHNQGGKGLGVRRFDDLDQFRAYVVSDEFEVPVDGITLLQEYVQPREPFITRVETVGFEYIYAVTADTERGGFQLCPADACEMDEDGQPKQAASLFALREGFHGPVVDQVVAFARKYNLEIAGFEFIESVDGRTVVYDVNTNTNYNPDVENVAPYSGPGSVAAYLQRVESKALEPALV